MKKLNFDILTKILNASKASQTSYLPDVQDKARMKFSIIGMKHILYLSGPSTQVYVHQNNNSDLIVSFRGTELSQAEDILSDLNFKMITFGSGKIHEGFFYALNEVYESLLLTVKKHYNSGSKIIINGHSLGGALAVICAYRFAFEEQLNSIEIITFGQPRVGDSNFINKVEDIFGDNYIRVVNDLDLVPKLPPKLKTEYDHSDTMYLLTENGTIEKKDAAFLYLQLIQEFTQDVFDNMNSDHKKEIADIIKSNLTESAQDHSIDAYVDLIEKCVSANRQNSLQVTL